MNKSSKKITKKEAKIIELRQKTQKAIFLDKLKETFVVQLACKKTGIGRSTYYRWLEEDEKFKLDAMVAMQEGKEMVNDLAQSKLIQAIQNNERWAIEMQLKSCKDDYRPKSEATRKSEEKAEEEHQRKNIRYMMDEIYARDRGHQAPWQINPVTGNWNDREKARSPLVNPKVDLEQKKETPEPL
jgi:hypothetical protein